MPSPAITRVGPESSGRLRRLFSICCPTRWALAVCLFVCVVAPVSLVAVHIHQNPLFSQVDEAEHYDYVERVAKFEMPRIGQDLLPSTIKLWECTGRVAPGWPPHCGKLPIYLQNSDSATNQYEAQQPPLYYIADAVVRLPFIHILGMGQLSGTRATGAVWLVAALLLLWLAGALIGLDWWVAAPGILLLCVSSNTIYEASLVTNDSASVFAGAVAAVMGALAWKFPRRVPFWLYALVGFVLVMIKGSDALGAAVVSLTLAVGAIAEAGGVSALTGVGGWKQWLSAWWRGGGMLLLGAVIGLVAWSIIFQAIALVPPRKLPTFIALGMGRGKAGWSELAGLALATLNPLSGQSAINQFRSTFHNAQPGSAFATNLAQLTSTLCWYLAVASGFAILFVRERRWSHWLGAIALPMLWLGGFALGISILKTYGYDTVLPGRYALSVAAVLVLALVGSFEGRWPTRLLWAFTLVTFSLSFLYMVD